MVNHKGFNVSLFRAFKNESFGLVATQSNNLAGKISFPASVHQSLEIGSAAGGQYQNFR